MRSAVVTGGGGFIGSNIARLLIEEGLDVRVLDDFSSGHRENLEALPQVDVVEGDVRDDAVVTRALESADVVFHVAAAVGNLQSIENPTRDSQVNVLGTVKVLESMRLHGVRRLVYSSSAAIFGELKQLPIAEDHPIEPNSPYGVSKLAAEKMCLAYAALYEIDVVCLRYFNVYGVNQRYDAYGNVIPIFVHRLLAGLPLVIYSDGEQTRDFVNVEDVARANLLAAHSDATGAFNVASGSSISINRLVEMLADASGQQPPLEHAPPRPGDVRDSLADISKAQQAFGYEPRVELEEGLSQYVDWVRNAGPVPELSA